MNKTTTQVKEERYETPEILDIVPVSVAVKGDSPNPGSGEGTGSSGDD